MARITLEAISYPPHDLDVVSGAVRVDGVDQDRPDDPPVLVGEIETTEGGDGSVSVDLLLIIRDRGGVQDPLELLGLFQAGIEG